MPTQRNNLNLGRASLKFLLISIGIIACALLLAWLIILLNGSFTFWSMIPFLIGFPVTILININLAKKTIAQVQNESPTGESQDEQAE